jgi:hypothetical protein
MRPDPSRSGTRSELSLPQVMTARGLRKARAFYTRALTRICERLDSRDTHEVTWKERMLQRTFQTVVRAESLWVVGSYARGALDCGDLDLVLQVTHVEGYRSPLSSFVSKALGRSPGVRFYEGDPENNSSHVSFPEAVHIWSKGKDWRRSIESIVVDPTAARLSRPTDEIPLRSEQLYGDVGDMEEVLARRTAGEIAWRFIPIDRTDVEPLPTPTEDESRVLRLMSFRGKKTRELAPYVLRYVRDHRRPLYSRYNNRSGAELELEGTFIAMGRPRIAHAQLDTLEFSCVALVPHFSQRGPNGIWELRRGGKHPFEIRMKHTEAYIHTTPDGLPSRICCVGKFETECQLLGVFTTREQAEEAALEEEQAFDLPLTVARIEGSSLLETLSYLDAIELLTPDGAMTPLFLTHAGAVVLADDDDGAPQHQTADSVLSTLAHACESGSKKR